MPDSTDDRNLLFGILALQNNFINREALLAAFAVWVVDKRRLLGDILCEQRKLSLSQKELLWALTDAHIEQHGNDPEQSLAAVSAVGSLHDELRKLGDPELDAGLAIVAQQQLAVDPNATAIVSLEARVGPVHRFRVLRLHATGGLGKVSIARDEELNREVAFKEILDKYADIPAARARFMREAAITARLEHPGIVPMYGFGRDISGRPFYAMRLIKGKNLKQAIERFHREYLSTTHDSSTQSVEFRKLLGQFIDVCNTIEYAHSRSVIHRDLKPQNIVLGAFGEVIVLDWGAAKLVDPRNETTASAMNVAWMVSAELKQHATRDGDVVGTPAYMSPEQAAGEHELIDARTDIYGLGAILFDILTGHPPHNGQDATAVIQQIIREETPLARQILPSVASALEAICSKAMAKHRRDRYPRVGDLSKDVQRWLADEPVSCYHDQVSDRMHRWTRRSRTALRELLFSYNSYGDACVLSSRMHEARDNFQQAFEIAHKLALADPHNTQAQRDLAISYNKLGDVHLQSGQVNEALESYQHDLAISQQLAATDARDTQAQRDLSVSYNKLGDVQLKTGQVNEALGSYQQGLEIRKKLAVGNPSDTQTQRDLSISYNKLGDVQLQSGQVIEALSSYQQGLEIRQKLAFADPSDAQAQRDLSISYNRLGNVQLQSQQLSEALCSYQQGQRISQKLAAADPSNAQAQHDLSISYERLGNVQLQSGELTEALKSYRQCLEISQKLAAADPSDTQALRDLSISYNRLGDVQLQSGQVTAALRSYQQDLEISQTLAAAEPDDAQYQFDLYVSYHNIGAVQQEQKQYEQAIESYCHGLTVLQTLRKKRRLRNVNKKWIGIVEGAIAECRKLQAGSEW